MTPLSPTEHRGFRELYLALQTLQDHWGELAEFIDNEAVSESLRFGTHRAGGLLRELRPATEAHGVYGGPGALGAGKVAALAQSWLRDPFLDQNQAARTAILNACHIANLLAYLAAAAEKRKDTERARLFKTWSGRFDDLAGKVRDAVCAMAAEETCVETVSRGPLGRLAERLAATAGNFVEASDQRWGKAQKERL